MSSSTNFSILLTRFFTQRLVQQKNASPHTIRSYRDTSHLLLLFAKSKLGKEPSQLTVEQIDAPLVSSFLDEIQSQRGIGARTRNLRLTAIRSFFGFAAYELPDHSEAIQRVLAIPCKRYVHEQIHYLTRAEVDALLKAPDQTTWSGRRDQAWLLLSVQTGLRLSELTGLTRADVQFGVGAHVHVIGKGRKERCTPMTKQTAAVMHAWLKEPTHGDGQIAFPNRQGGRMSSDGIQYLLAKHVRTATKDCPSMQRKKVSPHVLRHTCAMDLLQSGVDVTVIALWLGHESIETTHVYLEADLEMKRNMLAKTTAHDGTPGLYKPPDKLLAFLKGL